MQLDALPAGARLGEHVVVARLGQGGMGVVYHARDERLGRDVAIKVPSLALLQDATARARFEREVRASAVVSHPNVVTVFGVADAGGWPYLVLELLRGGSLRERLRTGGPLPWREACMLAREVALGLEAIHAAGLVHRDLKPENVLFDAHGRPKVADLGLVRGGEGARDLTSTGQLLGTRAYMAPEQIDQARGVGASADLYSLGCVLHELIAGAPPFPGSGFDVISKHLSATPPRLKDVPAAVAALVLSLLAKAPEDRPGSARAVIEALDGVLTPPSASATPRSVIAGAAVGLAVVVVGAVGALVASREPTAAPALAVPRDEPTTPATEGRASAATTGTTRAQEAHPVRLGVRGSRTLPYKAWDLAVLPPAQLVWGDTEGRVWIGDAEIAAHGEHVFVAAAGPDCLVTACRVYSRKGLLLAPSVTLWQPGTRVLLERRAHGLAVPRGLDDRGQVEAGVIKDLAAFADGSVVVSTVEGQVHVLEARGKRRRLRDAEHQPVLAVSERPRRVLAGDRAGRLLVWDLTRADDDAVLQVSIRAMTREEVNHPTKGVLALAVTPDGRVAVTGDDQGVVAFTPLDADPPAPHHTGVWHTERLSTIAVSPDGRLAVSGDFGGKLALWDVETGTRVAEDRTTHPTVEGKPIRVHLTAFLGPTRFVTLAAGVLREWEVEGLPAR